MKVDINPPVCKSCNRPLIFSNWPGFLILSIELQGGQPAKNQYLCQDCFLQADGWVSTGGDTGEVDPAKSPAPHEFVEVVDLYYGYNLGVWTDTGWRCADENQLRFTDDCLVTHWRALELHPAPLGMARDDKKE